LQATLTDMLPILEEFGVECLFFVTGASVEAVPSMLWYEELYLMFLAGPPRFSCRMNEGAIDVKVGSEEGKRGHWWNLARLLSRYDHVQRAEILLEFRVQLKLERNWRSRFLGDDAAGRRFLLLTGDQLGELALKMSIGAHTLSHPVLSQSSAEQVWNEISGCRELLKGQLQRDIWAFAYPFGDCGSVGEREKGFAKQAGFECAFMNEGGGFGAAAPRFAIPRVHVTRDMSLHEFEAHVSGFYRGLRRTLGRESSGVLPTEIGSANDLVWPRERRRSA